MDYHDYQIRTQQAAGYMEAGDYQAALDVLRELLASDIADLDKSMMCLNMAVVHEKMGEPGKVLRWYDEGMRYEARHSRFFVAEQKAVYLAKTGRALEACEIYANLLREPSMSELDKERLRHNERTARGMMT